MRQATTPGPIGLRCEVLRWRKRDQYRGQCILGGDTEQAGNTVNLAEGVAFCQPPDSTLVDHVHRFDSLQGPPRTLKRAVSFGEPDPLLHGSVILLDDVIQVLALAEANPARQDPFGLQRFHGRWIRW